MTAAAATATSSATATIVSGQKSVNENYTTFLTLLTTQLKNQDPTSPLDTNQFTQQLVQLTGVQQQLLSNELLQKLVDKGTGGGDISSAVNLIGKTATAATSTATLAGGKADWTYSLPANASAATLTVMDSSGQAVWSGNATALSTGDHPFSWNGKTASGTTLTSGDYTLSVVAADASGATIAPSVSIIGTVSAVSTVNGVTKVQVGSTLSPLSTITGVTSPASNPIAAAASTVQSAVGSVVNTLASVTGLGGA